MDHVEEEVVHPGMTNNFGAACRHFLFEPQHTAPLYRAKALTLRVKMNKFLENMVYVSRLVSSPL